MKREIAFGAGLLVWAGLSMGQQTVGVMADKDTGEVKLPVALETRLDAFLDSVAWDDIADKPATFPPSTHEHSYTAITNPPWATAALSAGGARNENFWRIATEPRYRTGTIAATNVLQDVVEVEYESDAQWLDHQAAVDWIRGGLTNEVAWSVAPADLATIDAAGYVEMQAPGIATVTAVMDGESRAAKIFLQYVPGAEWSAWTEAGTGTVRRAAQEPFDAALAAASDPIDFELFTVADHAAGTYTTNSAAWAAGFNWSGTVVATQRPGGDWGGPAWHGAAITPLHIISVQHAHDPVDTKKRFVGATGTLHERTIEHIYLPGGDIMIARLDEALPADVAVYEILPTEWRNYLPNEFRARAHGQGSVSLGGAIPAVWRDQHLRVYGVEMGTAEEFAPASWTWEERRPVQKDAVSGDSGSPLLMWLPDSPGVLLWCFTWPRKGVAWWDRPEMRAAVIQIVEGDGQTLTVADLTGYQSYE